MQSLKNKPRDRWAGQPPTAVLEWLPNSDSLLSPTPMAPAASAADVVVTTANLRLIQSLHCLSPKHPGLPHGVLRHTKCEGQLCMWALLLDHSCRHVLLSSVSFLLILSSVHTPLSRCTSPSAHKFKDKSIKNFKTTIAED